MKAIIKKILNKTGYDLVRYTPSTSTNALMNIIFAKNKIDFLIDVGANSGHYGKTIRKAGYTGEISSFEPIKSVYIKLQKTAATYKKWNTFNYAIGEDNSEIAINIAENSLSSSILDMHENHLSAAPKSKYIRQEPVLLRRLDSVITLYDLEKYKAPMLKIDVQGFELKVISGAIPILSKIKLIQIEMSFKTLYERGPLYNEIISEMSALGFNLFNIIPEFIDESTGELLQADGIFINKKFHLK
jgi:FkbM family methyltransferase